jgi:hypothetical protein
MIHRHLRPALLLLLTAVVACGDDDDPAGPSEPFTQTLSGTVAVFGTNEHSFTVPEAGTMEVELTWANSDIDLDLYLTDGACVGYPPVTCTLINTSENGTGNSEDLVEPVVEGAQYKIWVDNFDEELGTSYTIVITIE